MINSPDLLLAVQRYPKKLSFWFLQAVFAARMAGLSKVAAMALQDNVHGEDKKPSLFMDGAEATHKALKPCQGLDEMTLTAVQRLAVSMEELARGTTVLSSGKAEGECMQKDLWHWVNQALMVSTTDSIYGPKNPYQDPTICDAFL